MTCEYVYCAQKLLARSRKLPHLKNPFLTHHWIVLPRDALQLQEGKKAEAAAAQVLKVVEVVWAEPYEMELEYSFCSSSARPAIKELLKI